ncbi:K(+)-transporting ATPase subunit F [Burkholderia anthina]|uniref:K(+)-transporting ATPase subunit F n=1 Tax=Burkholderia anthina TaxID=179879 RepID=UPI001ABB6D28|nr:K(+)-transporting ATPase subunit F [Burkholderia anthina]
MYRLAPPLKRTHKNARADVRLYGIFIPCKEIEHRFDMRISTLSHPVRRTSTGGLPGLRRHDEARCADDRANTSRTRQKGKAMVWITGALSIALFIYLFHALIKPERY